MINGKKILAIIPARGGSKGVPRKNIRYAAGKPLIAWTIEEANKSKYIDRLIVSSDDEEIIRMVKALGCDAPFIRPKSLAEDETPGIEPVLHAIDQVPGYVIVVLLQPTSPLRNAEDIDGCIEYLAVNGANACVSVARANQSPYWMYTLSATGTMQAIFPELRVLRRQDLPVSYILNGAVYVACCDWLLNNKTFVTNETFAYVMPEDRSLDIDTELDLKLFELRKSSK
jgi:CMP-N,N'-diacetyllegionaminic acid synthase